MEQKLNQLAITFCPSTEPIGEVLNKDTDTLCNAQKKTSLENPLLQDISILNGNNSSQLEDWLTDIETASELMGKSRTKLEEAKSGGSCSKLVISVIEPLVEVVDKHSTTAVVFFRSERILKCKCL